LGGYGVYVWEYGMGCEWYVASEYFRRVTVAEISVVRRFFGVVPDSATGIGHNYVL